MQHNMLKRLLTIPLVAAAALTVACTDAPASDSETLFVSIRPLRSIVQAIVGEDFPVEVLVPAGASPETFEPTARQIVALNRAQLLFNVGLIDFETTLLPKIADPQRVVTLSAGVELLAGSCSHAEHHHGHTHAHGVDPHIWTSPRALQRMAANAFEAIRQRYPDSVRYAANHEALQKRLRELDADVEAMLTAGEVRSFILYHPAYTYYASDYGLQQIAVEEDGKEPSARRLAELIDRARADGVRRIFYQTQFPASSVEVLARDIGAEAVAIDPLAEDIIGQIETFTELLSRP